MNYEQQLKLANCHALLSDSTFNKNALSRRYHHWRYCRIAEHEFRTRKHQAEITSYFSGERRLNTYVFPFSNPDFAPWSDYPSPTAIARDPSGCPVRSSTSYCAYKIRELTGSWPKSSSEQAPPARDWRAFLAAAGYSTILPADVVPRVDGHYVGIAPHLGSSGLVVWYEGFSGSRPGSVQVSTYLNHKHFFAAEDWRQYLWVEIPTPRPRGFFMD